MEDPKPFYQSASFWGLIGSIAAPLLAKYGILLDPGTFATAAVSVTAGLVGLWGIFRRPDIKVLPK